MDRYELREEVKADIDFEGLQRAHLYDDVESLTKKWTEWRQDWSIILV